ncbi:MAG: glycosyltransferase [Acidimicrobiia bacterium]
MPQRVWAQYLAARIELLAEEIEAAVIVFDGVAPYRGLTVARSRMPGTPFVWFRRGLWQEDVNEGQLWKSGLFDLVIEPGDLASGADIGPTANRHDAVRVAPVSLLEVVERLDRREAASALGLDPDSKNILMTLGSGRLGDISSSGAIIMESLLAQDDWHIGVVTSSIAQTHIPATDRDQVVPVRGVFPLARYLNAFDAAVSAAGYNSVHELIPAGTPTLLVPNTDTRTDDQRTRAHTAATRGLALSANPSSPDELRRAVASLLDRGIRRELAETIAATPSIELGGGAAETVAVLNRLATGYVPDRASARSFFLRTRSSARDALKQALGPAGTNLVRRVLGRIPIDTSEMLDVSLGQAIGGIRELRFLDMPSTTDLLEPDPVEHLLPGSSERYREAREKLARRFYNVVPHR